MLHRLAELDRTVRDGMRRLRLPRPVHARCTISARSISRPSISTSARTRSIATRPTRPRRRAARTVLDAAVRLPDRLARADPLLHRRGGLARPLARMTGRDSVHLRLFPDVPAAWRDDALAARWEQAARGAPRRHRRARESSAPTSASAPACRPRPSVYVAAEHRAALDGVDLAEIAITSDVVVIEGPAAGRRLHAGRRRRRRRRAELAEGEKCERCWQVLPEVNSIPEVPGVCARCADAVRTTRHAA